MREIEGVGHPVKVVGHLQLGVINDIVGAIGPSVAQSGDTSRRQIVGMDVIGKYVIGCDQRRQPLGEAFQRQAIRGVNARRPQNGNGNPVLPAPDAQPLFGIHPPSGPAAFRVQATGFVNQRALAIAINPGRTNVDQAPW